MYKDVHPLLIILVVLGLAVFLKIQEDAESLRACDAAKHPIQSGPAYYAADTLFQLPCSAALHLRIPGVE